MPRKLRAALKPAVIFHLPPSASAVSWRWRSVDGAAEANESFTYYCDCAEDARLNGYAVETVEWPRGTVPTDLRTSEDEDNYLRFLATKPGPTRH